MRKSVFIFILALGLLTWIKQAPAEELSHIPGAFVDIGYGARPMGMGGAFVGLADDRNAVMWNPAGLLRLKGSGISFMWAKQLGFVPYNYLCYSRPIGNHRIGAGLIYSGDEVLSETTALLSFATSLEKLSRQFRNIGVALNLKIRQASFGNNSSGDPDRVTGDAFGYGLDFGLLYLFSPKISFGIFLRDCFNDIRWNSSVSGKYSESIPAEFTMGAAYRHSENTVIAADIRKSLYSDVEDRLLVGLEQKIFDFISLRAGWAQNIGARYNNQEIALGAGVTREMKGFLFSFDFAYMLNDLKNTPRAGASLDW